MSSFDEGLATGYALGRAIGHATTPNEKLRCWNCGARISPHARYCSKCGKRV